VRRIRDKEFEKPVDNYDSSSSSRGTLKKKQGWRWAARAKPVESRPFTSSMAMTSVICQDIPPIDERPGHVPKPGSAETRRRLYLRARTDWSLYHQIRRCDFFFSFLFFSGGYRMMIGHMRLPFVELGVRRIRGY